MTVVLSSGMASVSLPRSMCAAAKFLLFAIVLSACSAPFTQAVSRQPFDSSLFDPTDVPGVELPPGYLRSWDRDQIVPVYEPTFVEADFVDWDDDEVVIGININGEQRAYPVGFLSNRELVIDEIDDIPILVSW